MNPNLASNLSPSKALGIMFWMRALLKQASLLLLAATLAAWATATFRWTWKLPPEIRNLPLAEIRRSSDPILWVDVREGERFQTAHIPEAIHFDETHPQTALQQILHQWTPKSQVVVYGEGLGSERALRVAKSLKTSLASPRVFILEGGWLAWPKN